MSQQALWRGAVLNFAQMCIASVRNVQLQKEPDDMKLAQRMQTTLEKLDVRDDVSIYRFEVNVGSICFITLDRCYCCVTAAIVRGLNDQEISERHYDARCVHFETVQGDCWVL